MKGYYDVVIAGAGPAGLECAKNLAGSRLSVLLLEKNRSAGGKVCAGGIIAKDSHCFEMGELSRPFEKVSLHYKGRHVVFPEEGGTISTIDRRAYSERRISALRESGNVTVMTGTSLKGFVSDDEIRLSSGHTARFRYLVGADGSVSAVRRHLGLGSKFCIGIQYLIPRRLGEFEIHFDDSLFGTGFLWIFPHEQHTSIGCGTDLRVMGGKELKRNLDSWLRERGIRFDHARFESAVLNYDYRGYRFGQVFLAGDAAGLVSGISGKGMHPAIMSGRQIAKDILGENDAPNLVEDWVKTKRGQERLMFILRRPYLRRLYFSFMIRAVSSRTIQRWAMRML